ncbi:conserved hypothetical protein [Burkholderiales bacterium]|nr:conserved hypothetical protein [Burkholderiales bacterium]
MSAFLHALRPSLEAWLLRRHGEPLGDLTLERHRIFILPTRAGFGLAVVALTVWYGSLNFNLQLGYLLAFSILSIALISMYQTHRNLVQLSVREQRAAPVHAGEIADFDFVIDNPTAEPRFAINLAFVLPTRRRSGPRHPREQPMQGAWVDIAASSSARVSIGLPTRRRGQRLCPRVRISTRFPFGLWEAWAYASPQLATVVYPAPETDAPPLPLGSGGDRDIANGVIAGNDDFAGVRPYRPGDPLRSVAWRLAARSDELSVKLFESSAGEETVLDYDSLPSSLSVEQHIARLTRWVLVAEAAGLRYSLNLPGSHVATASGPTQRARCLEALALFPA